MMLRVLIVVALVGAAFADDDCCSAEDRREISYIWKRLWSSSFTDRKVIITNAVFDELFTRYPEAKTLFTAVHVDDQTSPEWRAHLVRFANGIDMIINLLEDPDVLSEQLKYVGSQFLAKGVKKTYIDGIADGFEHVLPKISSCFNVEAWHRCFRRLATVVAKDLP